MRHHPVRRTLASVAVLAVCATSLSACGGGAGSSGSASSSTSTKSSTKSSASASSSSGSSSSSGHLDRQGLVRALTVGQTKGGSAHMVMKLSGPASLTAQGDVDYSGGTPEMSMTMAMAQLGSSDIELRLVRGIIYMRIPKATPAGKFLKIDPKDTSNPMSRSFGALSGQLDPMSSFRAMRSAARSSRYVGKQTIEGTSTDHYVLSVDSARLFKATGQKLLPQMPRTLTYDLWLDGKDLLRRMRTDTAGETTEVTFSDWGKSVDVTAPPASAVVTGPSSAG